MDRIIRIAGIQIFCDRPKKEMLNKAEKYMEMASKSASDIDLFVLPEQFYQMDCYQFEGETYGEWQGEEFEAWIRKCAEKFGVNIIGGSYSVKIPANDSYEIHNRCLVADRNGDIVGFYDKIHLFDAFGVKESDIFTPGNKLKLFQLDVGKVGIWICYDTRFPEMSRSLTAMGADILCVPAAFYSPNADQWDIIVKSAAIYNVTPVIAVNQYGSLPNGRSLFGRSRIVDAKGLIVAGMSDKEGYFIGEIDQEYTRQCRFANPEMKNRREDLYAEWYQKKL